MLRLLRSAPLPARLAVLLVAGTVALAGWQILAGDRLGRAGRWIDDTQEWQILLIVTAEAIEDGSLQPAEGGGFELPWEDEGAHPFPIDAEQVSLAVDALTVSFPLRVEAHDEAARRATESHGLLQAELEKNEKLGPLATVTGMPPLLRSAAIDAGALIRPVNRVLGQEADEAGRAGILLALAALACAAAVIFFVVQHARATRENGRLVRHLTALQSQRGTSVE